MTETMQEMLKRIRKEVEAELPIDEMYRRRLEVSFSSQQLWMLHEAHVTLALLDPVFAEISAHHREFTSVVLMQRGMNG